MGILNPVQGGNPRLRPMTQFQIPPNLVVAQGVSECTFRTPLEPLDSILVIF
jgi:hypothetical protein